MINFYEFEQILHEQGKSKLIPITKDNKVVGYKKEGSTGWKNKENKETKPELEPIKTKDNKVVGYRKNG